MAFCFVSLGVALLMVVCQDRLSNYLRLCPEIVSEKKIDFTKSLAACEISNFLRPMAIDRGIHKEIPDRDMNCYSLII